MWNIKEQNRTNLRPFDEKMNIFLHAFIFLWYRWKTFLDALQPFNNELFRCHSVGAHFFKDLPCGFRATVKRLELAIWELLLKQRFAILQLLSVYLVPFCGHEYDTWRTRDFCRAHRARTCGQPALGDIKQIYDKNRPFLSSSLRLELSWCRTIFFLPSFEPIYNYSQLVAISLV